MTGWQEVSEIDSYGCKWGRQEVIEVDVRWGWGRWEVGNEQDASFL